MAVSTCTRQLLIRVGEEAGKWIREGFQSMVVLQLAEDRKAEEAISQPLIACGRERVFNYSGEALGVRDKIFWDPEDKAWYLKVSKPKHPEKEYCEKNNLNLRVSQTVAGKDFKQAMEVALMDACVAWNEIGGSKKHRISLPASGTGPNAIELAKGRQVLTGVVVGGSSDEEQENSSDSD